MSSAMVWMADTECANAMQPCSLAAALFLLSPAACGGGEGNRAAALQPASVESVIVTVDASRLQLGSKTPARVIALDRYGGSILSLPVQWNVEPGRGVVSVSDSGVVTGTGVGTAALWAAVDSVIGNAKVVVVLPGQASGKAELPQVYLDFPFPPVTGRSIEVGPGGNLQSALNRAERGDEIVLAAGATYKGNFILPAKRGSAGNGWITIRTDRLEQLPPVGTRVNVSHAALMPKIESPDESPAIRTAAGASGWRLVGLEVTVTPALTKQQYGLIWLGEAGAPQSSLESVPTDLVLDRMYIHGQTNTNMSRCVALHSARTQVSDSYIVECHGKGFDSQAIWGSNGPGPYRIVDNTLQGAGENIMFGGADPAIRGLVPSDIEISQNHLVTPISWKGVWSKKNLLELKNASRVLIEANVLEGSWRDGQTGEAFVFKSVNQSGGCRWCRTTDVTARRNLIRNAGAGVLIAGAPESRPVDTTARRIVITENVLENLNVAPYNGVGRGFTLSARAQDIILERNIVSGSLGAALNLESTPPMTGCTFRENVWARGSYGVIGRGARPGTASLSTFCSGFHWSSMALVGTPNGAYPPGTAWLSRENHAVRATTIRRLVEASTIGVVQH